jgi:DNA ligase N terminus
MSELQYSYEDNKRDEDDGDDEIEENVEELVGWDFSNDGPAVDDPVAEGDDPIVPRPQPSYAKASETKFFSICKGLEIVCKNNRKRDRTMSEVEKLKTILKPEYLKWLAEPKGANEPPESVFPVLRLLIPEKDGSRSFQMKERTLGKMYADAFCFNPGTLKYNKLLQFNNPNIVGPDEGVGDFSMVVYNVIRKVKVQAMKPNGLSVGEINKFLDELASLPRKAREAKSNHDWRNVPQHEVGSTANTTATRKPPNLNNLRADWLRKINMDTPKRHGLSPLEHKWLVRILLNKLHIGVGWKGLVRA